MRSRAVFHTGRRQPIKDQALEGRQFSDRATLAFLIVLGLMLLLSLRYMYLQVISIDEYTTQSVNNQVRIVPVPPNRGLIYDRRGRPVAENRSAYRLEVVPEKVEDLEQIIESLGRIVDLPEDVLEKFEKNRMRYREFDSVPRRLGILSW